MYTNCYCGWCICYYNHNNWFPKQIICWTISKSATVGIYTCPGTTRDGQGCGDYWSL